MANLETLELTIKGNAQKAADGIDTLITSLGKLSGALTQPFSDLVDFNAQLEKLKALCKDIKIPDIAKATGAAGATKAAAKRKSALTVSQEDAKEFAKMATPKDILEFKQAQVLSDLQKELSKGAEASSSRIATLTERYNKLTDAIDKSAKAAKAASGQYMGGESRTPVKSEEEYNRELAANVARQKAEREETRKRNEEYRQQVAERARIAAEEAKQRGQEAFQMATTSSKSELLTIKLNEMTNAYIRNAMAGNLTKEEMADLALRIQKLRDEIDKLNSASNNTQSTMKTLKDGFKNLTKGISNMFGRIKKIATTMLIRSALRGLIKSIKEGISNVREWAKVNNHEFYNSMDKLKSKTKELKNSIGAAFVPIIQAVIPILTSLSNAIIDCANKLNQFFSLLAGKSTWIEASSDIAGYTDETKKATGATNEWLASFDELNVMSKSSGSSSSSSSDTDYANMFREVSNFDSKIREIASFLKKNLGDIEKLVLGVGVAIASWKLAKTFEDSLPLLSKIFGYAATLGTIAVTVGLNWMLTNEYLDTGKDGYLWAGILTTAIGSTAAWAIAKKLIGGKAGTYAASVTLMLTALADIKANIDKTNVDALSKESITTNVKAAIEGATGIGLLAAASGAGLAGTIAASGGAALIIFGVAMGLKAIANKKNVTWDSKKTIISALTAAIPVGLGLFVLGAGAAAAAVAAITTFGVVVALEASVPEDKITWGEISLTDEQVQTFVESKMFTVKPTVVMELTKDNISSLEYDEKAITEQLESMMGTLYVVNLGLATDDDYANLKKQITDPGGLVDKVVGWINDAEVTSKLVLQFTPDLVGGAKNAEEWYKGNITAWNTVSEYVQGLGKELADLIVKGEGDELKVKRPERVTAILNEIARISEIVAGTDQGTEALIEFDLKLKDLDSSSFEAVMTEYKKYKEEIAAAALEIQKTAEANQIRLINALTVMLEIDPNNKELQAQLEEAKKGLAEIQENWQTAVDESVEKMTEPGKSMLQEWVNANFDVNSISVPEGWDINFIDKFLSPETIQEDLKEIFTGAGFDMEVIDINDLLEVGGWDLLTKDLQKAIVDCFGDVTDKDTIKKLKDELKLTAGDIISVSGFDKLTADQRTKLVTNLINAYGSKSAIAELKKKIPNISVDGIIKMTDWKSFTKEQRLDFIDAIGEAFGSEKAKKAAKNAGIDIGQLVEAGMKSENEDIKAKAQKWSSLIGKNVKSGAKDAGKEVGTSIISGMEKKDKAMKQKGKNWNSTIIEEVKSGTKKVGETVVTNVAKGMDEKEGDLKKEAKDCNGVVAEEFKKPIPASIGLDTTAADKAINEFTNKTRVVKVTGEVVGDFASSVSSSVVKGIKDALGKTKVKFDSKGNVIVTAMTMAQGGVLQSGDVFVAREAGPELVGSIGSRTAVVNNDQIIQGISSGVEAANSEQNALLRRQNEILMGILQKSGNVTIGASSALGRVVNQSLEMYGSLVGR